VLPAELGQQLPQATLDAHTFWFQPEHQAHWFASTAEFDHELKAHFGQLLQLLTEQDAAAVSQWPNTAAQRLGLILLCDQFPRNIFRGQAQAYELDQIALATSKLGIQRGEDAPLGIDERSFFYLPFEHSESLLDQHTCVGLLTQLRDSADGKDRERAGGYLRYAHQHRDIIQRFGRFPHRNDVLHRTSSAAEAVFSQGGSFGQ
jgi:uncharacterized protein (DUF924 family)